MTNRPNFKPLQGSCEQQSTTSKSQNGGGRSLSMNTLWRNGRVFAGFLRRVSELFRKNPNETEWARQFAPKLTVNVYFCDGQVSGCPRLATPFNRHLMHVAKAIERAL